MYNEVGKKFKKNIWRNQNIITFVSLLKKFLFFKIIVRPLLSFVFLRKGKRIKKRVNYCVFFENIEGTKNVRLRRTEAANGPFVLNFQFLTLVEEINLRKIVLQSFRACRATCRKQEAGHKIKLLRRV